MKFIIFLFIFRYIINFYKIKIIMIIIILLLLDQYICILLIPKLDSHDVFWLLLSIYI